jgi:hypothetical protein
MAVQMTTSPPSEVSPPDRPNRVNGYTAHYGSYGVGAEEGTLTHHRRNHIYPAVGNLSVVRHFRFEGDVLNLTIALERHARLSWARVR